MPPRANPLPRGAGCLIAKMLKRTEDAQRKNVSTFGNDEHLRQPIAVAPSDRPQANIARWLQRG